MPWEVGSLRRPDRVATRAGGIVLAEGALGTTLRKVEVVVGTTFQEVASGTTLRRMEARMAKMVAVVEAFEALGTTLQGVASETTLRKVAEIPFPPSFPLPPIRPLAAEPAARLAARFLIRTLAARLLIRPLARLPEKPMRQIRATRLSAKAPSMLRLFYSL